MPFAHSPDGVLTRQPTATDRINWRNPITRDLRAAVIPALGIDFVTHNIVASKTTLGHSTPTDYTGASNWPNLGLAEYFNGSTDQIAFKHHPNYATTGAVSIASFCRQAGGSNYGGQIVGKQTAATTNVVFEFRMGSAGNDQALTMIRAHSAGQYRTWSSNAALPGMYYDGAAMGISCPAGIENAPTFYQNGVAVSASGGGSATGNATDDGASQLLLGKRYDGTVYLQGWIAYIYIWARVLTADEFVSIYRAPWQVFARTMP